MRKFPDLINIMKDDGFTPLHLAATNDHLDVLTAIVDHVRMYADQHDIFLMHCSDVASCVTSLKSSRTIPVFKHFNIFHLILLCAG